MATRRGGKLVGPVRLEAPCRLLASPVRAARSRAWRRSPSTGSACHVGSDALPIRGLDRGVSKLVHAVRRPFTWGRRIWRWHRISCAAGQIFSCRARGWVTSVTLRSATGSVQRLARFRRGGAWWVSRSAAELERRPRRQPAGQPVQGHHGRRLLCAPGLPVPGHQASDRPAWPECRDPDGARQPPRWPQLKLH